MLAAVGHERPLNLWGAGCLGGALGHRQIAQVQVVGVRVGGLVGELAQGLQVGEDGGGVMVGGGGANTTGAAATD